MECRFTHVAVDGIATVVPPRSISIDSELEFFQNSPKKLERAKQILGFGTRHVVDEGVTALDLCHAAAEKLLADMHIDRASIDALIVVNQSPDYFYPAGSCIVHGRLGLEKSCATLDIALGCSGYVYGLWLAHSLIASGASKKLLLLAGDTPSLHSDRRNRLTNPLFGDAGTATLLSSTGEDNTAYFVLGSDGNGWSSIVIPGGGFRLRPDADMLDTTYEDAAGNPWKMTESLLDGMAVFDFTLHEIPASIQQILSLADIQKSDIDFYCLHQANKQIVQAIGNAVGLESDDIYWQTFSKYGNQSTASVPSTLCDALQNRMQREPLRLLLSGFGVGLSWANAILSTRPIYNGGVSLYASSPPLAKQEQIAGWAARWK